MRRTFQPRRYSRHLLTKISDQFQSRQILQITQAGSRMEFCWTPASSARHHGRCGPLRMKTGSSESNLGAGGHFVTTHWSAVMRAGQTDSVSGHEALSELCQAYWYPLYGFIRRQGRTPHEAEDLTQGRAQPDHLGQDARAFARANILAWNGEIALRGGLDAIVVNASVCWNRPSRITASCSATIRSSPAPAAAVAALARDVAELMAELGLGAPSNPTGRRVAYHSACSLQHGQQVRAEPKGAARGGRGLSSSLSRLKGICAAARR